MVNPTMIHFLVHLLQNSEHNRSLDDLDEEESPNLLPVEELQEDAQEPPQAVRCGGEDGEPGGAVSQRSRQNVDIPGRSSVRRGRGKVEPFVLQLVPSLLIKRKACVYELQGLLYVSVISNHGLASRSPGQSSGSLLPSHSGGAGDGGRWGGATTPSESLNEQIVVALARLQEDMQSVLERLHTLEALTASQVRPACLITSGGRVGGEEGKRSWWHTACLP